MTAVLLLGMNREKEGSSLIHLLHHEAACVNIAVSALEGWEAQVLGNLL